MPHMTRPLLRYMKYVRLLMFMTMTPHQEAVLRLQDNVKLPLTMVGVTKLLVVTTVQYFRMRGKILN
jgi:hypothetical protein